MNGHDLSRMSTRQRLMFGVVFVFPWLLGHYQFGELLGHIAVVVSVLVRKHWGW